MEGRPLNETVDRPRRTLARDQRRKQVIEATISIIAARGLARLTLTDVARAADISHGLVLFHFASKENLLAETLAYLADEYQKNWEAAVLAAGPGARDQLHAMIEADFHPAVTTPARLAAWCAFWGESQSRPLYQARCGANDEYYNQTMKDICARMNADYGYRHDAERSARLIRIMIEGVWLDMMTLVKPYPVPEALDTVFSGLSALYPQQFPAPV